MIPLHKRIPGHRFLHSPGPTRIPDEVAHAMARQPMDLADPRVDTLIASVETGLKRLLHTDAADVFLYAANGHGVWEATIVNLVAPGQTVLVPGTGHFSESWAVQVEAMGGKVIRTPWIPGLPVDPAVVEQALRDDREREIVAVFVVHTDTATGVTSDLAALRAAVDAADHPALFVVDVVASLAAERFEMDALRANVVVGAAQKGLMTPPGLAFVAVDAAAFAVAARNPAPRFYWDWRLRKSEISYRKFCGTMPQTLLMGMEAALALIFHEGLDAVIARHRRLADAVHAAVGRWAEGGAIGFFGRVPAARSTSVTTITTAPGIDPEALRSVAREHFEVAVAGGLGPLAGRAFRIGHLGDVNPAMVLGCLAGVEAALRVQGIAIGGSGVEAAIASLARGIAPVEGDRAMSGEPGRATALIHHPYQPPAGFEAVQPGVHKASTIVFRDVAALRARDWKQKTGYTYGLHGTPTTFTLEERIATLEGGRHTLLVPSGLAAITLVDVALLQAGDEVLIPDNAYGPGKELARHELARWGIGHRFYDAMDAGSLERAIGPATKLVWLEAAGSVTMEFPDLRALVRIAKARGVVTALDNTWGAGIAFDAFDLAPEPGAEPLGVDVCMQALTKYPSGGGDVLMGSVTTRDTALHHTLAAAHMRMGWGIGGNDAEAVLRALPSLDLRYAAQDRAGRRLAEWLASRDEVAHVLHPALPGAPGHDHWRAHCRAAAGLFSIVLDARFTAARVDAFVDALRLFKIGYSWAGPVSLVVPYDLAALQRSPAWRGALVRFSVGLEDVADLVADLEQALGALTSPAAP